MIKIVTNTHTFRAMPDNMDINAGAISDGESTVQQVGRQIFDTLLEVASGRRTCAPNAWATRNSSPGGSAP